MSEELKTLFPDQDLVFEIDGRKEIVTVRPFKIGQLRKLAQPLAELASIIARANGDMEVVLGIINHGGENLIKVIEVATGKGVEWFDNLEMDQAIDLIAAIIAQNKDKFEKKVSPALLRVGSLFQKATEASAPSTEG